MDSFGNAHNFDNLLLQTLMGRLQVRPQTNTPFLNKTLEDILFDNLNLTDTDEDDNDENKTQLAQEESKLEKEIIKRIRDGKIETLKPNSGQAVTINGHHICVGFHQEVDSGCRAWEWHGHIMLFDDVNGYSPEYIYGNYFERVKENAGIQVQSVGVVEEKDAGKKKVERLGNLGLRELIGSGDESGTERVLHRNLSSGSPRV